MKSFFSPILLMVTAVVLAVGFVDCPRAPQTVHAQSSTAFQLPFTVQPSTSVVIIPPCGTSLPTKANPCIPNQNQLGHSITFSYAAAAQAFSCSFTLDGSNDNSTFVTLSGAANPSATAAYNGLLYANGYYSFLRVKVEPCTASVLTATYTGYPVPLPINIVPDRVTTYFSSNTNQNNPVIYGSGHANEDIPFMVQGFQCFNSDASITSLFLYDSFASPSSGAYFFDIVIPAGATYNYSGPPFLIVNGTALWTDTSKTLNPGGGRTNTLICNFETLSQGPLYPITAVSQ